MRRASTTSGVRCRLKTASAIVTSVGSSALAASVLKGRSGTASATCTSGHEDLLGEQPVLLLDDDGEAAEQGRRDVVGVALHRGGQPEHVVSVERPAQQRVRAEQAGRDGRRARAEPGARRHADVAGDAEAGGRRPAGLLAQTQERARDQVIAVARQRLRPGAARLHHDALALEREPHVVPEVERQPQTVEPRPEVRGGGRDSHPAGGARGGCVHAALWGLTPRPRSRRDPALPRCGPCASAAAPRR